nr:uncharacterized protein LOC126529871 [Dermacentor andersoni]
MSSPWETPVVLVKKKDRHLNGITKKDVYPLPLDKRDAGEALLREQLNVLILGLDATSQLNFNRRISRTRRFLVYERGAYEFLMCNKVGLSLVTYVMPLLMGVSGQDVMRLFRGSYHDSVPAIWKVCKSLGYATLYIEEMPNWAAFTGPHGFKKAPTDCYAHTIMLQMHYYTSDDRLCMGRRLKTKEVLGVQQGAFLDAPMEQFFRDLSASSVMDTTAVLFLSDHGMCQENFRMTEICRHEDNTPFGLCVFPRRFLSKHSEVAALLEVNPCRLVTTYDFHATLLSLPALRGVRAHPSTTGVRLFSAEKKLDDASLGQSFALFAVAHLNALAEAHIPGKCAMSRLDQVDQATIFGGNVTDKMLIHVSLKTLPEGHFDVYGDILKSSSFEYHVDIIDSTDIYVNKTASLKWSSWQKVCNCKDRA